MHRIALCDDDKDFLASFTPLLSDALRARRETFQITAFSDTASLLKAMEEGDPFSLVFLDVVFGEEEGIRAARSIRTHGWDTEIVFVSSAPEFAAESFDVSPLHFLVKPVSPEKLAAALDRYLERAAVTMIRLETPHGATVFRIDEILYFEIYSHKIIIHKADGTRDSCTGTLSELETSLPPQRFIRPHRSYLVNLDRIVKVTRYQILLSQGSTVPVSKVLYQKTQDAFVEHAGKKCLPISL